MEILKRLPGYLLFGLGVVLITINYDIILTTAIILMFVGDSVLNDLTFKK